MTDRGKRRKNTKKLQFPDMTQIERQVFALWLIHIGQRLTLFRKQPVCMYSV